jgi:hypothetical protein
VVDQLAQWVEDADPKTSIAACKALIAADAINVRREQGPPQTAVNVGVAVSVGQSVEALLNEPDYIDWLESRQQPSPVCQGGQQGQVSDTPPHPSN